MVGIALYDVGIGMQIGAGTLHRVASCQEDNQGGDQLTNPFLSLKISTF